MLDFYGSRSSSETVCKLVKRYFKHVEHEQVFAEWK